MPIDTSRHEEVFSANQWDYQIDVIGAGATGSRIVLGLAKLGLAGNLIRVWDADTVERHNIANQVYGLEDIGKPKVEALATLVERMTGAKIQTRPEMVDGSQRLGTVVFLLTDSMASRKEIWMRGIKLKPSIKLMIETRMGVDNGRIYTVSPSQPLHIRSWEEMLYSSEQAQTSACGTPITVGSTAEVVSGLAVWQLLRWWGIEQAKQRQETTDDELEHEIVFTLRPQSLIMPRLFSSSVAVA